MPLATTVPTNVQTAVETSPPAKLNLFLEITARRCDGFHEIDTVMVPIDLRDHLLIQRLDSSDELSMEAQWMPSSEIWTQKLSGSPQSSHLAQIPSDENNLVIRALAAFRKHFGVRCGFHSRLFKGIPAGAGMGGASSDAASALRCASLLCEPELGPAAERVEELAAIAATIGSDVPFFLGLPGQSESTVAARARGRGELLNPVSLRSPLPVVVAYPRHGLSTAEVYGRLTVPSETIDPEPFLKALSSGNRKLIGEKMTNRLTAPAREIRPEIDEMLESMWRSGLQTCQLTGSGSACFAITDTIGQARRAAARLRAMLQPGALVWATHTTTTAPRVRHAS
ncbi:4-(cytidine 5'-diphospho)-2-C-methyl-D-erythritol kinase [Stieleria varia]|uniref:4-diphosphocytidyl-2-C-methyl-D-erythritol kinase n=1 Tax=Stieleria varia TaxID=2528005 RepID=A0A5C6B0V8_9BACT|nr:4-(cytidine 5'-diphospho)-2-C-methyl-D-erythritol kinase [Stieleria varia]TWU05548.1 4-diphosphocytidyl-2-C-methyl-D-erythritol kinase [Stieleria varia]